MGFLKSCVKTLMIVIGITLSLILAYTVNAQNEPPIITGGNQPGAPGAELTPSTVPGTTYACADSVSCLKAVAANTYASLVALNNLPNYLENAGKYILNWTDADTSETTQQMQSSFTMIGNQFINNSNTINTAKNLTQLMADITGQPVANFTNPRNSPDILKLIPNINDLAYATVLNLAPVEQGATKSAYNYIKNAGGMTLQHPPPRPAPFWQGKPEQIALYTNYYNIITAISSFDNYILDYLVAENINGNQLTPTQNDLIAQATSGNWLATVAAEKLGAVFRQLLMFQSQSYVLLTQLLQTQKQMLSAQVMTNTLLIATNITNEQLMSDKAQGLPLQP